MLGIFEAAASKGDDVPRWHPEQGVDAFECELRRAGLTQIGQWRMEEEAPHLSGVLEEVGPQQRCLKVVRGVLEGVQAIREPYDHVRRESEVGSLLEALRSSCLIANPVQPDKSQVKQFARALLKVVDDVRTRFRKHGDVWWLLEHLQYGCVEIIAFDDNCRRVHEQYG